MTIPLYRRGAGLGIAYARLPDREEEIAMAPKQGILSEDLLRRFHERAPVYDRENRFFAEDFEDLQKTDYLKMAVPREHGGLGMTLAESARETRRLAYYAPATALAVNMHTYWCGVAAQ